MWCPQFHLFKIETEIVMPKFRPREVTHLTISKSIPNRYSVQIILAINLNDQSNS